MEWAGHQTDVLTRKMKAIIPNWTDVESKLLQELAVERTPFEAGTDIVVEGDRPSVCALLSKGIAAGYKMDRNGRRHLVALYFPGDVPDLQSLHLKTADTGITALTKCDVSQIRHDQIRAICSQSQLLTDALWRTCLIQASIHRAWEANLQRPAQQRAAHLMCEILVQNAVIGHMTGNSIPMPLTQTQLSDALGMSTVHMNRIIQELRHAGFIEIQAGVMTLHDWAGLSRLADFDPTYLHLREPVEIPFLRAAA